MKRLLALTLAVLPGCYKTHFVTSAQPATPPPGPVWHHNFVYGLIELNPTDLDRACPTGVARIDYQQTLLDGVLHSCVGGWLWQPSTIQVWCATVSGVDPNAPPVLPPPVPPPPAVPPSITTPPLIH